MESFILGTLGGLAVFVLGLCLLITIVWACNRVAKP